MQSEQVINRLRMACRAADVNIDQFTTELVYTLFVGIQSNPNYSIADIEEAKTELVKKYEQTIT